MVINVLCVVLIWVDLDCFKNVNDILGYEVGDVVLCYVVNCLVEVVGDWGFVVCIGGDEFLIFLW